MKLRESVENIESIVEPILNALADAKADLLLTTTNSALITAKVGETPLMINVKFLDCNYGISDIQQMLSTPCRPECAHTPCLSTHSALLKVNSMLKEKLAIYSIVTCTQNAKVEEGAQAAIYSMQLNGYSVVIAVNEVKTTIEEQAKQHVCLS